MSSVHCFQFGKHHSKACKLTDRPVISRNIEMRHYRIAGQTIDSDDPRFAILLGAVYGTKSRPLCLCREPGVEMYIAKVLGHLLIKRMPESGGNHAPACDSYEPPLQLSALGQLMGTAIQENPENGITKLKLDFALTKRASRTPPVSRGTVADSVRTDGSKLTLRGTLSYLWDQAGLNRWSAAMRGKRNWFVIRKYLIGAAANKIANGSALVDILYIPESFSVDRKNEIGARRAAQMMTAVGQGKGARRLMLAIGEVKEITPSRYGYKMVLKHCPDFPFMLDEDLHRRLKERFDAALQLWDAMEDVHLMLIGTFGLSAAGIALFEELALMAFTEQWLPMENAFDKTLIDTMVREDRRFIAGLRYNLPSTRPLACVVATDTDPAPTAMYIVPPGASQEYNLALNELVEQSKLASWIWRVGVAGMPPLPR
jgi:Protein of unknown function (DUF1173)